MTTTHDPLCPTDQNLPSMSPMGDWREQAKAAIEEALGHGYSSLDNFLGALVDAVEPIIVREMWKTGTPQQVREVIEAEVRERIAQEIEAMCPHEQDTDPTCPYMQAARIARGEQS